MLTAGPDALLQFNYSDTEYTVTYATLGSGSGGSSSAELPDNIVLYAEDEEVVELPNANSNKINYSLEEQVIGTWLDGKPLYQKTVYVEGLPNSSIVNYEHNIENVDLIYTINSFAVYEDGSTGALPMVNTIANYMVGLWINKTSIEMATSADRSGLSAYITVQYTKTTD
jgi:hypothetical protein